MLQVGSALKGYAIEANDGSIGTVSDFLFDDRTWKMRWLVVDTGNWLPGRLVLIHPSAIGRPDYLRRVLPVNLTKAWVEGSPDILTDRPVSQQMQMHLFDYYGWDPVWGSGFFGPGVPWPDVGGQALSEVGVPPEIEAGDPHLRSLSTVTGYDIQASDGAIGHLENVLIEDDVWGIHYLIVDTKNWWPGQHVLVSPYAVREISWPEKRIVIDLSREKIKASPAWKPLDLIDQAYEKRLHHYYDWPGYGW